MSGLDIAHRQFANTPEDKFQYQLVPIQLMRKKMSTINEAKMKTKSK